jgi:ribulose-5-phosphate 4-epimerase/fuculose-1-phosphate aldolase
MPQADAGHAWTEQAQPRDEREARVQLAAAYRLAERFGMTDLIYNHISLRVPGADHHFLINPFGRLYRDITASSLVKIDLDGNIVGESRWPINPAGFVIHGAVHRARPEVNCVLHTHTTYGATVAALESGLLPISQFAMRFYGRVAYHDYEGLANSEEERDRLAEDLGDKAVMILRNHGLLTTGRTVGEAFVSMEYLERACRIQVEAQSTGGKIVIPPREVCEMAAAQFGPSEHELAWPALVSMLDEVDPSYKD